MRNTSEINNGQDVIDSRDVIARIKYLQNQTDENDKSTLDEDEKKELEILLKVQEQGEGSPDWVHGESLIHDDYFTEYIEDLIKDCYELPKEFDSGKWPYRHLEMNYEAAAEEAKADYMNVDFDGVTYWIRSC